MRNPLTHEDCIAMAPLLSALLDDELSAAERADVETHLRECPACARTLEQTRAARELVRGAGRGIVAPTHLRERLRDDVHQARRDAFRRRVALIAGIAAVFALCAVISVALLGRGSGQPALYARGVTAHRAPRSAPSPVSFATTDMNAASRWAAGATGRSVDVPGLDAAGFRLLGVREEPAVASGAIATVYASGDSRLTCLVLRGHHTLYGEHRGSRIRLATIDGSSVASWWEEDATYLLIGDVAPNALLSAAQTAVQADAGGS